MFQPDGAVGTMQVTDDAVWVFDLTGVLRVDPATNTSTHVPLTVEGGGPSVLGAIGFDSIWAGDFDLDQVRRYDATTGELAATVETQTPEGVLATDDGIWVANHRSGTVSRIDPESNQIAVQIEVGGEGSSGPKGLIEAGGDVWVGIPNKHALVGIDPEADAPDGEIEVSSPGGPCGPMSTYGSRIYIGGCVGETVMEVVDYREAGERCHRFVGRAVDPAGHDRRPAVVRRGARHRRIPDEHGSGVVGAIPWSSGDRRLRDEHRGRVRVRVGRGRVGRRRLAPSAIGELVVSNRERGGRAAPTPPAPCLGCSGRQTLPAGASAQDRELPLAGAVHIEQPRRPVIVVGREDLRSIG